MADPRPQDFATLCAVHDFFLKLLARQLRHELPLPAALEAKEPKPEAVDVLRRWLNVLDLAITPPMVRDEIAIAGAETAAAVLRYYVRKPDRVATDRDKTDFVVTWLYRNPDEPNAWDRPRSFEQRIFEIVGEPVPVLPDEHLQLVREFEFIEQEVEDVRHFDALVDSSMVQRVRDIKSSFGESFYHPTVLATVANYNVQFGKKFDELFKEATRQIKSFAQSIQQQGGSVLTRVEGDVTVKQLEDVEDQKILKTDYREAQEQFRKVSKFKKAVDSKRKGSMPQVPVNVPAAAPVEIRTVDEAKSAASGRNSSPELADDDRHGMELPSSTAQIQQVEEGKLRTMGDSIRNFVKAADPARAQIVPMRHGNVVLAPAEVDAFRVDYLMEKSFRADFANALMQIVSCGARIDAEMADFRGKQSSAYLWKPHADALAFLVRISHELSAGAAKVGATAQARGLADKAAAMNASLGKLSEKAQAATQLLAQIGSK